MRRNRMIRAKLGKVIVMTLFGVLAMVGSGTAKPLAGGVPTGSVGKEREPVLREIAYTATLAKFISTNCQAFAAALAPSARKRWLEEEPLLRVKNVQLFLPDFFKVVYVYNGSVNGDVFCFGLYNPFYDYMLVCKAQGLKQTEVVDYKWVSGAVLRGGSQTTGYSLAKGVNPPEQYFPTMLKVLEEILASFNHTYVGPSPDIAFAALPSLDKSGIGEMLDIAIVRSAQAVKMTGDKSAYGLATLATLILRDEKFSSQPFLGQDEMTRAMVKILADVSVDIRTAFRPIGYFEADNERCVLLYNCKMPRLLALARSKDGKNIQLGMFDANSAGFREKKPNLK